MDGWMEERLAVRHRSSSVSQSIFGRFKNFDSVIFWKFCSSSNNLPSLRLDFARFANSDWSGCNEKYIHVERVCRSVKQC